jgi:hypothetical protein
MPRMKRAQRQSLKYLTDECTIIKREMQRDQYGNRDPEGYREVLYEGKCFVSPGNMWPFETGGDVVRGARTDDQFYVPRDVEGLGADCLIEYANHQFEVIAFANPVTAGAMLNITGRRVS